MRVFVESADREVVVVNVQEAKQSFKWLANVVQSRIIQATNSNRVIVTGISNKQDELIDPRDKICEHAQWDEGNWHVKATMAVQFPNDEWGNPVYGDWVSAAYLNNEDNYRWSMEMESWRNKLSAASSANQEVEISAAGNNLIQIGGQPDIDTAFELDWSVMDWKHLPSMSSFQKDNLRKVLQNNYDLILAIFMHYCGAGSIGERYGMTTVEYSHLLKLVFGLQDKSGVQNSAAAPSESKEDGKEGEGKEEGKEESKEDKGPSGSVDGILEAIEEITKQSILNTAPESMPSILLDKEEERPEEVFDMRSRNKQKWVLMSRAHVVQALVFVALERNTSSSSSKSKDKKVKDDAADAVLDFLQGPLANMWASVTSNYTMYKHSDDETFVDAFNQSYYILKQAFLSFGSTQKARGPIMSTDQMLFMFKNTLWVGSVLSDKDQDSACLSAFREVQVSLEQGVIERGYYSILMVSCALDSCDVDLSYPLVLEY